jgi:hypothetical protein
MPTNSKSKRQAKRALKPRPKAPTKQKTSDVTGPLKAASERMARNRDERPEAIRLVANIKAALPELEALHAECVADAEDAVYRFYHQSFKVYGLQDLTARIATKLRALSPDPAKRGHEWLDEIIAAGTGKKWKQADNANWTSVTRPIVEAFFHARYFLEMTVHYGREFDDVPPSMLPSGWAAVLYLYGLL